MYKKTIAIIVIVIVFLLLRSYIDFDTVILYIQSIKNNAYAPFIFLIIYIIAIVFAAPASLFSISVAALFGFANGTLLIVIGSNIGCIISYYLAKKLGQDTLSKFIKDQSFLNNATQYANKNSFIFIMYARLIPLFPFAAVNYISGIINIPFKQYALATFLGMLPGTLVYVYIGYSASNVQDNPLGLIASIIVFIIFTSLVYFVNKRKK